MARKRENNRSWRWLERRRLEPAQALFFVSDKLCFPLLRFFSCALTMTMISTLTLPSGNKSNLSSKFRKQEERLMNVVEQLFSYSHGFSDTLERDVSPNGSLLHHCSKTSYASNSYICHRRWRFCKFSLCLKYFILCSVQNSNRNCFLSNNV